MTAHTTHTPPPTDPEPPAWMADLEDLNALTNDLPCCTSVTVHRTVSSRATYVLISALVTDPRDAAQLATTLGMRKETEHSWRRNPGGHVVEIYTDAHAQLDSDEAATVHALAEAAGWMP